jgi:hypothetical protein
MFSGCAADDAPTSADLATPDADAVSAELRLRCGRLGESCCAGNTCRASLNCNFNTQICTSTCGAGQEPCCGVAQSCDEGLFCNFDHCAASCGERGQACCRPENRCFDGSICSVSTGLCG